MKWSKAETKYLIELRLKHKIAYKDISIMLGRSVKMVERKMRKTDKTKPILSQQQCAEIIESGVEMFAEQHPMFNENYLKRKFRSLKKNIT